VNDPGWAEHEETWLLFDGCPIHELLADYYDAKKDLDIAHIKNAVVITKVMTMVLVMQ